MFGGTNIRPVKNGLNEQFCVGAQTVVSLLQTSQIISDVCFITDHVAYASSDKTSHLNRDGTLLLFFFFTRSGCVSCLHLRALALGCFQSYQYPNLSEGADRVGGQLH